MAVNGCWGGGVIVLSGRVMGKLALLKAVIPHSGHARNPDYSGPNIHRKT